MASERTIKELQSPGAIPKTRRDETSRESQSPAMHERGIQNPTRRDRESQSSVRRDNICHTDSSKADEFYLWKLILRSPLAQSKLFDVFRNEFTVSDGRIEVKDGSMQQSDGNFRRDLRTACTAIRVRVYRFKRDVPEEMQDIQSDIEALKRIPGTRKKPANPYLSEEANIEVVDREEFGEIEIVTTESYFERCINDVEYVLRRHEVDLIDGEDVKQAPGDATESNINEKRDMQEDVAFERRVDIINEKKGYATGEAELLNIANDVECQNEIIEDVQIGEQVGGEGVETKEQVEEVFETEQRVEESVENQEQAKEDVETKQVEEDDVDTKQVEEDVVDTKQVEKDVVETKQVEEDVVETDGQVGSKSSHLEEIEISSVEVHSVYLSSADGAINHSKGPSIEVVLGELARQQVDVIVNTSNEQLNLAKGAVSKSLLQKAGIGMQHEVTKNYPRGIKAGEIAETHGYRLDASRVLHCCLMCWNAHMVEKQSMCRMTLKQVVERSLHRTATLGKTSIAFPALGTGVLMFPPEIVARDMISTVQRHYTDNPNTSIQKVFFVIYTKDTALHQVFMSELRKATAEQDVDEGGTFGKLSPSPGSSQSTKVEVSDNETRKETRIQKYVDTESDDILDQVEKNFRQQKTVDQYPRVVFSKGSVLKKELNPAFQVAARKGNIVDFEKKGVIVCPQDAELTCHGSVAEAIQKTEMFYYQNLHTKLSNRRYQAGEVQVCPVKSIRCSVVYNVVVPHPKSRDMNAVRLCYTQVLRKADQNSVENIALPLFCTGHGQAIEESARALASALVELANSKKPGHKFPAVYIYAYEKKTTETVARVLKGVLMERNDKTKTNLADDDDDGDQYHTPPTSPESQRRNLNPRSSQQPSRPSLPRRSPNRQRNHHTRENQRNTGSDQDYNKDSYEVSKTTDDINLARGLPLDATLESTKCCICMDSFKNPKTLSKCGHTFCTECIDDYFKVKPVCPFCFTAYGILTGTQPKGGNMHDETYRRMKLPGYDHHGVIRIRYNFPDGIQGEEHPDPGKRYQGTLRIAYLPDTAEGHKVLKLLKLAFKRRLVFTIGRSVTTGVENIVTWNDIHHKTNISGGPSNCGYPDPDYLTRVTQELEAKGVTEADIQ